MTHVDRLKSAIRFLTDLFGEVPDGAHILLWTMEPDGRKVSHWFTDPGEAAAFAVSPETDRARVYVGVGWHGEALGEFERGTEEHIAGIPGLWADIDVAGAGHISPKTYAATEADACAVLDTLPLRPSIVVRTGGGLHAWWLFREPFEITSDEERATAKRYAREWGETIIQAGRKRGVDVDSVFDLPRVLRIPGTYRNKEGDSQTVIERAADKTFPIARYNLSDFEPYLTAVAAAPAAVEVGELTLRRGAQPPALKFIALMENEDRFMPTFLGQRRDMRDSSQSAHDQSMANFAAAATWEDQEIADLVMASREKNGAKPEKALRLDYIRGLIGRARASVQALTVESELEQMAAEQKARDKREQLERDRVVEAVVAKTADGADRGEILAGLSKVFGVEILAVIQYGTDQARYTLKTSAGELSIGGVDVLLTQGKLRSRLYEAARHVLPRYKTPQWDKVCRTLQSVLDIQVDDDVSRVGELRSWVASHVLVSRRWIADQYEGALMDGSPFFLNGNLYVHADALSVHVKGKMLEPVTKRDLLDRLRGAGFARKQVGGRPVVEGKKKSIGRNYWGAPISFLGPAYNDLVQLSFTDRNATSGTSSDDSKGFVS